MPLSTLHPLTKRWFHARFAAATEPQRLGWPAIAAGRDTLIAAPTGSGKTLAAFLAGMDRLLRLALADTLEDRTYLLYVSPLRALSNDIRRNLQGPLEELMALARGEQPALREIRALVRTGDTPSADRQRMVRKPPHILVTTPESLYLLLTSARSRQQMLQGVETVVVDEIHALARDKRGSHLALSLERLEALCDQRPMRIGLSATQKPIDEIGRFLVGAGADVLPPRIVDIGHSRQLDLAVEVPGRELQAVCSHEHWAEVYERLVGLIEKHRSTLIFVNTRRLAERITHQLTERLGEEAVASHHGSLSREIRQRTERALKEGRLKAVVATASLELGIDIGHVDLVCQLGSPRSIATLLQRVGRAGHSLGAVPKGRLFALSREELIECLALVRAVYAGTLDRVEIPKAPLDILAQQIVAAVACEEWDEDSLFALCRRAYPYRDLSREDFDAVLEMLSAGVASRRGRRGTYLHRDRVGRRLRARRGARITAVTCGGAIPELADYRVVTDDEPPTFVGTVDEDFAVESLAGDVFLLGNTSWRIRHVRGGQVVVRDAQGAPPTIPFWRGEAPGRTFELSQQAAALREELAARVERPEAAVDWLAAQGRINRHGAEQAVHYVASQKAATGMVPTQQRVLFERFFDEAGGMQLVVHAPFGTRINRAWGLAMRKRFCRSFNFELQASADDNGIVLSLGEQHSFPLDQMFSLVHSRTAREVLTQALLAVPFFTTRWRWNATRALAVRRAAGGKRVPPYLQRMRADDLLSAVFPMQTACLENVVGDIEVPKHPLVDQTVHDCLHEAMDVNGWLRLLEGVEKGSIELIGLDSREPSPFSHELLNANPYAFLDDAPLEERRARAVTMRRSLPLDALRDLGRLDPEAIGQVCREAWPLVRDADELHDALLLFGALPAREGVAWAAFFEELRTSGRVATVERPGAPPLWTATENVPLVRAIWRDVELRPDVSVPAGIKADWNRDDAVTALLRGRLECVGPVTEDRLADDLALPTADVRRGLAVLESEGFVLRGHFTPEGASGEGNGAEWCDRRLLARIHRLTLEGLRRQIEPVSPERFLAFLMHHQHLYRQSQMRSQSGLLAIVEQLQGFEAPAAAWERQIFPARMDRYDPEWLERLCVSGQVVWGRLRAGRSRMGRQAPAPAWRRARARPMKALHRAIPITFMLRADLPWLMPPGAEEPDLGSNPSGQPADENGDVSPAGNNSPVLSGNATAAYEALERHGALFLEQLSGLLKLAPLQVQAVLGELAAAGLVTSDGVVSLRGLIGVAPHRHASVGTGPAGSGVRVKRRGGSDRRRASTEGGRWSLLRSSLGDGSGEDERVENWCRQLLLRYGVMFRDLLSREAAAPPWRDLVRCYRRLEARGEVRGGRFVAEVSGEQYALPECVEAVRRREDGAASTQAPTQIAATDPVNLFGRITSGEKVPARSGKHMVVHLGAEKA